ncbi:hypothetical protein [Neisseria musculi]|uniref:hypothetical protein n=1 Tax=Neisseria musculi TaxID=1815583 RepID=UPI003F881406
MAVQPVARAANGSNQACMMVNHFIFRTGRQQAADHTKPILLPFRRPVKPLSVSQDAATP